ncbi:hypothetical protein B0H11DRAFT_2233902 [Mycena galericulata]|nr:hypothetical protein B0H11DRAFT_2233902 [Mycena galericulata]
MPRQSRVTPLRGSRVKISSPPILGSKEYRDIHNIADNIAAPSVVPTSLSVAPIPVPSPNDWVTVNYRGGRGGPRGHGRGGCPFRGAGRGYGGSGYMPYTPYRY